MASPLVYGLITDEPIMRYCKSRNIPCTLLPISENELTPEDFKQQQWGEYHRTIRPEVLYRLVEQALPKSVPIAIWGSSSYHHVTHARLRHMGITEAFTLFIGDNHPDTASLVTVKEGEQTLRLLTCGNHVTATVKSTYLGLNCGHAMHYKQRGKDIGLRSIVNAGPGLELTELIADHLRFRDLFDAGKIREAARIRPHALSDYPDFFRILDAFCLPNAYLTVDIDALSPELVDINSYEAYRQGDMQLEDLIFVVEHLFNTKNIVGMDICGMTPDPRCFEVYDALIAAAKF
jgi:hypothetical protein